MKASVSLCLCVQINHNYTNLIFTVTKTGRKGSKNFLLSQNFSNSNVFFLPKLHWPDYKKESWQQLLHQLSLVY